MPAVRQTLRRLLSVALLIVACPGSARADGPEAVGEYQRKAQLICSFIRWVRWPEKKFAAPDSPIVIGIYGTDSISETLTEMIRDRRFEGRPVFIKRITVREELRKCHILFVSNSERDRLDFVLREVRRENVLTVGESRDFISRGGVVDFVNTGGSWGYQFSKGNADREDLKINTFILSYAVPAPRPAK